MLSEIRSRIDKYDDEIVRLFSGRLKLAGEIADIKKNENRPAADIKREEEIISRLTKGKTEEMAEYIKILYAAIFDISRSHQAKLMAGK